MTSGNNLMFNECIGVVVIAGGQDSTVRFWQADNGQSVATFEAPQPKDAVAEGDGE